MNSLCLTLAGDRRSFVLLVGRCRPLREEVLVNVARFVSAFGAVTVEPILV